MKEAKKGRKKRCSEKQEEVNMPKDLLSGSVSCSDLDSTYPYLSLLAEICSMIDATEGEDEVSESVSEHANRLEFTHSPIPYVDARLFPYSSLLQKLIKEISVKNFEEFFNKTKQRRKFHSMMSSLCYPVEDASCSQQYDKDTLDYFQDMTYASKLKYIGLACQRDGVEVREELSQRERSNLKEIRFILTKMFPSLGNTGSLVYSEKLKDISDHVRRKEKHVEWERASFPHSSWDDFLSHMNNTEIDSVKPDLGCQNANRNGGNLTSPLECNINTASSVGNEGNGSSFDSISCHKASKEDTFLFEALMRNVHSQSLINHKQIVAKEEPEAEDEERPLLIHEEPPLEELDPALLGEVGIKIIERRLNNHLRSFSHAR